MDNKSHAEIGVFLGVDVGKGAHHAVALDRVGERLLDRPLPNDETQLRGLINGLRASGPVLLVVDQPATVGALVVAVAHAEGVSVGYLPGLVMRRIADLHPGEAKTDPKDAYIIAEAARAMPHTIRSLSLPEETLAELIVLSGFDDDLASMINQTVNRLRGLLTQVHPALERTLGPRIMHPAVLDLLQRYPTPEAMRTAGRARLTARLTKRAPRLAGELGEAVWSALSEQSVVVAGTAAAAVVVPRLAQQLDTLITQRADVIEQVEELVDAHPLSGVLISMPGVGVRTAARILTETAGKDFPTAGHLAAYAGLAPVTRRSGTSIRGEQQSRRGNKKLKRVLFLAAFAALKDPASRAYYDRKRDQGKSYNQAIMALARRRCDVLFAMLRDGTYYNPEPSAAA